MSTQKTTEWEVLRDGQRIGVIHAYGEEQARDAAKFLACVDDWDKLTVRSLATPDAKALEVEKLKEENKAKFFDLLGDGLRLGVAVLRKQGKL